jgi:hypothetical protein
MDVCDAGDELSEEIAGFVLREATLAADAVEELAAWARVRVRQHEAWGKTGELCGSSPAAYSITIAKCDGVSST